MAYVTIPKDLSRVQSKVLFGLTKRQVICFGAAALVGVPLFFLAKASLGTTTAALCMILVMLPFFLFAMYEKNGQTPEALLGNLIQCKFTRPKKRVYQTNNAYSALEKQAELERTVGRIASGAGKRGKGRRRLTRQERKQIEAVIRDTLTHYGIENAEVTAVDKGALDCTVRARVTAAIFRSAQSDAYEWEVK